MINFTKLAVLGALCIAFAGCGDVGSAPPGMSENDAKSAIEKMSPEDQIRAINSSPMPGPEKAKKFQEIEEKTGVKAADVLKSTPQMPGAGAVN